MLSSCEKDDKVVLTGFSLEPTQLALVVGGTAKATATPVPADAEEVTYTWSSANPSVASITSSGSQVTVTAVAEGETKITVTSGSITAELPVSVSPDLTLTAIILSPNTTQALEIGESVALTAAPVPTNSDEPASTFKWSSSDETVVSLSDATGGTTTATALGYGTVDVTVTNADGSVSNKLTIDVGVATIALLKQTTGLWSFEDDTNLGKSSATDEVTGIAPIDLIMHGTVTQVDGFTEGDKAVKGTLRERNIEFAHPHYGDGLVAYTLMFDCKFEFPGEAATSGNYYMAMFWNGTHGDASGFFRFPKAKRQLEYGLGSYFPIEPDGQYEDLSLKGYQYPVGVTESQRWYRFIYVWYEGVQYGYMDGVKIAENTGRQDTQFRPSINLTQGLSMWFQADGGAGVGDGDDNPFPISTLAVWDFPLTQEEITLLGSVRQIPSLQ
jgi:hypothetical protein